MRRRTCCACIKVIFLAATLNSVSWSAAEQTRQSKVDFVEGDGRVAILLDGMPVAVYCYQDKRILRPYFAHVRTISGVQVTRNHPPIAGFDLPDHDTLHPGIWLAFGDINGFDFWRNNAQLQHVEFAERPHGGPGKGIFAVRNRYLDPNKTGRIVCNEVTRYTVAPLRDGYLITWDSHFTSDKEFTFGDQEEMGLGIRMATPLRVGNAGLAKIPGGTGTITNSAGDKNEKSVWGKEADWCDYSGTIAGETVGATILCHPGNFRKSTFHARDYGLITANPFGQKCFGKPEKNETKVLAGDELRLRYGIFIHSSVESEKNDSAEAYQDYVRLTKD